MRYSRRKSPTPQIERKPARPAPGVQYTSDPRAPGLPLFRCEPFHATLSMTGCASRWRQAQLATGHAAEAFALCRGCPIGAAHAGEAHVAHSKLFGAAICPRCRHGATRMIHKRTCVSCYNRSRELARGRNGRGNAPVELRARAPRPLDIRIAVDGLATRQSVVAVDRTEVIIQTLRATKGAVEFGYAPVGPSTLEEAK